MKDIGKAFSFVFRDPEWVVKVLVAALFMCLSLVGVGLLFLAGYYVELTQRVIRREESPLPAWGGLGHKFVLGFKYCVVYLVYLMPVILLTVPLFALGVIGESPGAPQAVGAVLLVWSFAFTLLMIPYSVALTVFIPIITYRFAANERIGEALDIGAVFATFKKQWQSSLVVALVSVGVQSFAAIGIVLFLIGIFFTIFYAYAVSAYLNGALYLEHMGETPA